MKASLAASSEVAAAGWRRRAALFLAAATFLLYLPTLDHGFVATDDDLYVTAQPMAQKGLTLESVGWAFTNVEAMNWQPLTWLSHMIDCELFGLSPRGHHFTNAVLMATIAALTFLALFRLTGDRWRSVVTAGIYAWHPLRVESAAWIAERKDLLGMLFGLLAILAYADYARNGGKGRYAKALTWCACSLMAKATLVTLPILLLLLDYWPLRRFDKDSTEPVSFSRLALEKVPFLILAIGVSVATVWAQDQGHQVQSLETLPLGLRLANSLNSCWAYVWHTLFPFQLALFYPMPESYPPLHAVVCVTALAGSLGLAWTLRRRFPFLLVGWLWYLVALTPVIGIVQVGMQAMADRYTLTPHFGLITALVWGGAELAGRRQTDRRVLTGGLAVLAIILSASSAAQIRHWRNSEALYRRSIAMTDDNEWAHCALGNTLTGQGRLEEARAQFAQAARINPGHAGYIFNLAALAETRGRPDEAAAHYEKVVALSPDRTDVRIKFGLALHRAGRRGDALKQFAKAAELEPGSYPARLQFGLALAEAGVYERAVTEFQAALKLAPPTPELLTNLAAVLNALERFAEALAAAERAVALNPALPDARYHLAMALQDSASPGDRERTREEFGQALKLAKAQGRGQLARMIEARLRDLTGRVSDDQ